MNIILYKFELMEFYYFPGVTRILHPAPLIRVEKAYIPKIVFKKITVQTHKSQTSSNLLNGKSCVMIGPVLIL